MHSSQNELGHDLDVLRWKVTFDSEAIAAGVDATQTTLNFDMNIERG